MEQQQGLIKVKTVAWGLIVYVGLSLVQPFINPGKFANIFFHLYFPPLQLVWLISTVILAGFMIGSINMLRLEEFGRSLIVCFAIIDIPHLIFGKAIYNNYQILPAYIRNYFLIPVSIIIDLGLLYYLNDPKVKALFK